MALQNQAVIMLISRGSVD